MPTKSNNYSSAPTSIARDKNLSLKAKGLYLLIKCCLRDPEFDFMHFKMALAAECKEGSKAFESAWRELKEAGYLKQFRTPYYEGAGFHYAYKILTHADKSTSSLQTFKSLSKSYSLKQMAEQESKE
jgi:hypothetical protein